MNAVSSTLTHSIFQVKSSESPVAVPVQRASRASALRNNTLTYSGKASPRQRLTSLVVKAADGVMAPVEKAVEPVKGAEESDPNARNSNIKIDPKDVIMMQVSNFNRLTM